MVFEGDSVLRNLDENILVVHLRVGVDDDRLHPDDGHPVLLLVGQQEVEQLNRGHGLGGDLYGSVLDKIPGKVGSLAVVLHEVFQEGDHMEARSEVGVFLRDVGLDGSQMVVVGETVEVDQDLDPVALIDEARHKGLPRELLVGLQLDSRSLHGMEFGVEEWFTYSNLKD